jgi:hypothetical protein
MVNVPYNRRRSLHRPPRVHLMRGSFGFLLGVGASPTGAFRRTMTPYPRIREDRRLAPWCSSGVRRVREFQPA